MVTIRGARQLEPAAGRPDPHPDCVVHPDGTLGPRETHLQFDAGKGAPDGMTCDHEGGLWIVFYSGAKVARFHPDGQLDREIALPTPHITNVCFAGADLSRMFVTSAADGRPDDP